VLQRIVYLESRLEVYLFDLLIAIYVEFAVGEQEFRRALYEEEQFSGLIFVNCRHLFLGRSCGIYSFDF
jgi:hypothetical protein